MTEPSEEMVATFRDEAAGRLDAMDSALMSVEAGDADDGVVDELFRDAHTLKGTAGMLGLEDISSLAHAVEDVLSTVRDSGEFPVSLAGVLLRATGTLRRMTNGENEPAGDLLRELAVQSAAGQKDADPAPHEDPVPHEDPDPGDGAAREDQSGAAGRRQREAQRHPTIRVPAEKIDDLVDMVGEVIQDRQRLAHSLRHEAGKELDVAGMLGTGERVLNDLRDTAVGIRTLPISVIAGHMSRAVRDLAHSAGKDVELVVSGGETELDRAILESLPEPLTHLFRNAIDHGIEPPDDRVRKGKPRRGKIELRAVPRGGLVEIEVSDDGRGVPAAVAEAARSAGSLVDVLTRPGFSTSSEVTDLAGRGVGLDAVRAYTRSLGGSLDIRSVRERGTTIVLLLPLVLALMRVLAFGRGGGVFGVPVSVVEEVFAVQSTQSLRGGVAVELHGRSLPLVDIAVLLGADMPDPPPRPSAVATRSGDHSVAVLCDELIAQEEMIVKPLGPLITGSESYLGGAILADGRIVLVLDPMTLSRPEGVVTTEPGSAEKDAALKVLVVEDSATVRELHRRILETAGYAVVMAEDGSQALDLIHQDTEIALVITDLEMPGLDGVQLTRTIRADRERQGLPVIIVTSHSTERDQESGIGAGADAFIAKWNFQQRELLSTIERLLGRRSPETIGEKRREDSRGG